MSDLDVTAQSSDRLAVGAAAFVWDGGKLEPGLALAMSGGGYRAMLFHVGALMRLNELGLLSAIDRISSVSGGSIAAGFLAAAWVRLGTPDDSGRFANFKAAYVEPILAFSRYNIDATASVLGLLPGITAAGVVAKSYERHLVGRLTLQDIPDRPRFVFCATNLQTGVLFRFTKPYAGDYILGRNDKPRIQLSRAIAASSAFPPVLSPMKLKMPAGSFSDWPTSPAAHTLQDKTLAAMRRKVILSDGGVYDNHGLEPLVKRYMTLLVSDGGAPFARQSEIGFDWVRQLRRILHVTDNQVRAQRRRDLIGLLTRGKAAFDSGTLRPHETSQTERLGAYWGIDTNPDSAVAPGALLCSRVITDSLAQISTRLADPGEVVAKQLVNWGYAICDRSLRAHYRGNRALASTQPAWPFEEAAL